MLLLLIGIGIGRYLAPPRTVYRIGTPIDPTATNDAGTTPADDALSPSNDSSASPPADERMAICGAMTKSGRPCRRKVKGGGRCYQHRDKDAKKNTSPPSSKS